MQVYSMKDEVAFIITDVLQKYLAFLQGVFW
jgi:hypothetical protein